MYLMIASMLVSLVIVLLAGPKVIPMLHKLRFGQTIYELAPETHKKKQGIPTMGGLMVVAAVIICTVLFHAGVWNGIWDFSLALLAISLGSMLVGFTDDFNKVARKRNMGLTPMQKIVGQTLVAVLFSVYCYVSPYIGSKILVPFVNLEWDLGLFYIPLVALLIIFMVNSSNILDGLDGLLCCVTSVTGIAWATVAVIMMMLVLPLGDAQYSNNFYNMAIFSMALTGAAMGFLPYNFYPARVFLGDTGSMFVGGATVGMALLTRQPLMLILINFAMIASSGSVMIQRTYFKLTHGKRIFKMSPVHHHFELCGYSEAQIDVMYAVVTAILSVMAIVSLYGLNLVH